MNRVTVFKSFRDVDKPHYSGIHNVLDGIRDGRAKEQVESVRNAKTDEEVGRLKLQLPCVLFAGVFDIPITKKREDGTYYISYRNDESLSTHSRFVCFDVDDVDDIKKYKEDAKNDPYIYALWTSPSGTGLHGLIKIADGSRHEEHYTALLKRYPIFDPTARNPSRVLFFSYDPDIYINEDAKVFFELTEKTVTSNINMSEGFTDYKRLGVAAKMIRISEPGGRHNAVIKSAYLIGGLIAGGIVEEDIGRAVLEHEVRIKFDSSEIQSELRAVNDGIAAGKYMPVSDIEKYETEVKQAVGAIEEELSFLSNNRTDEEFIRKYRAGLIPMGKPFGYFDMDNYLMLKEGEFYAILSHSHTGKAQPLSSKILTPKGWRLMRDISIGDDICGIDGGSQKVNGIFPQGVRDVYKVTMSDDSHVYCDKDHLWSVNKYRMRHSGKKDSKGINRYVSDMSFVTIPLSEMIGNEKIKGGRKNGINNYMLPRINPIKFQIKDVLISPYLIGLLLGDGSLCNRVKRSCTFLHNPEEQILKYIMDSEYYSSHRFNRGCYTIIMNAKINKHLDHYGLVGKKSDTKFIPNDYIYNSIEVRLELLCGLLDTDGYVDRNGSISYTTTSEMLRDGVCEIVNSLGGRCLIRKKNKSYTYKGEKRYGKTSYDLLIKLPPSITPFKIDRKANKVSKKREEVFKYIKSIEYSHKEECQCIKVSNADEMYITDNYIPTHNTQTTLWLIFLSALKYDWCWVIYTGENRVASVKMRFVEFFAGVKIKDCPEDFFQQAIKWINERFFFINNDNMHDYKEILNYAESVSRYHAVKGLLIDPVNALKIGKQNKYDHEMEMYTNMLLFTKRTNISILLSIHTRTQSQRERDKSGNQLMPFPADADGGAVLYNKSDIFIVMNRNIQDPETWMITELYVSKNRNKETGGDVTPRNQPIKIRMNKGIEFTDELGNLPFSRDYLRFDKKLIDDVRDEDLDFEEAPF